MKIFEKLFPTILVIMALIVTCYSVYISGKRDLTGLENTLLQSFGLLFGVAGSFLFGRQSMKDAAKEIIKPHARSAFRRLISLYESLSRVAFEIENSKSNKDSNSEAIALAKLEAIVIEQLATADDALEDWGDIVPNEVAELRQRLRTPRNQEKTNG